MWCLDTPAKDVSEASGLGEKRKRDEIEQDKENDGAKELNVTNEKRSKETEAKDSDKLIEVAKKDSSTSDKTKPVEDDEEGMLLFLKVVF